MRVVRFTNWFTQSLGLMFRRPRPDTVYVFDFGRPVQHRFHMWFVFAPIDVHFLDGKGIVVDRKRGFTPFSTYRPAKRYRYAVETLPGLFEVGLGARFPQKI